MDYYDRIIEGFGITTKAWLKGKQKIKKVAYCNPATIIFWDDDTKTVCKIHDDEYNPIIGFALCCAKKLLTREDYEKFLKEAESKIEGDTHTVRSCNNCKYAKLDFDDPICKECDGYTNWQPQMKKEPEVPQCFKCKYYHTQVTNLPCRTCKGINAFSDESYFKPKEEPEPKEKQMSVEKRNCYNCKYEHKASWENPCFCCYSDRSRWEPKEPNND